MKKNALITALACALMLAACSADAIEVTERHIQMATQKCRGNDGVQSIAQAEKEQMYESCGYRCTKPMNQHEYSISFSCKNGAVFNLKWQE